jgi:hypothetical protein
MLKWVKNVCIFSEKKVLCGIKMSKVDFATAPPLADESYDVTAVKFEALLN